MKRPYLRKMKMYTLAKYLCRDISLMKDCEYSFYRGSEWLEWDSKKQDDEGRNEWKLYISGNTVLLEKKKYLYGEEKYVTLHSEHYDYDKVMLETGSERKVEVKLYEIAKIL